MAEGEENNEHQPHEVETPAEDKERVRSIRVSPCGMMDCGETRSIGNTLGLYSVAQDLT